MFSTFRSMETVRNKATNSNFVVLLKDWRLNIVLLLGPAPIMGHGIASQSKYPLLRGCCQKACLLNWASGKRSLKAS